MTAVRERLRILRWAVAAMAPLAAAYASCVIGDVADPGAASASSSGSGAGGRASGSGSSTGPSASVGTSSGLGGGASSSGISAGSSSGCAPTPVADAGGVGPVPVGGANAVALALASSDGASVTLFWLDSTGELYACSDALGDAGCGRNLIASGLASAQLASDGTAAYVWPASSPYEVTALSPADGGELWTMPYDAGGAAVAAAASAQSGPDGGALVWVADCTSKPSTTLCLLSCSPSETGCSVINSKSLGGAKTISAIATTSSTAYQAGKDVVDVFSLLATPDAGISEIKGINVFTSGANGDLLAMVPAPGASVGVLCALNTGVVSCTPDAGCGTVLDDGGAVLAIAEEAQENVFWGTSTQLVELRDGGQTAIVNTCSQATHIAALSIGDSGASVVAWTDDGATIWLYQTPP